MVNRQNPGGNTPEKDSYKDKTQELIWRGLDKTPEL